jgi:hypothetical protein
MNNKVKVKREERIKKQHIHKFKLLMENQTPAEKEEVLIGEKYLLKGQLAQAKEQALEMEKRIATVAKFSLIGNKLAFDGVICEEEI